MSELQPQKIELNLDDEQKFISQYTTLKMTSINGIDAGIIHGNTLQGSPLHLFLEKTGRLKAITKLFQYKSRLAFERLVSENVRIELQAIYSEIGSHSIIEFNPSIYKRTADAHRHEVAQVTGYVPFLPGQQGTGIFQVVRVNPTNYKRIADPSCLVSDFDALMTWNMGLLGLKWGLIAFTDGYNAPLHRVVAFDPTLYRELVEETSSFWNENVKAGILPIPVGSVYDLQAIEHLYPLRDELPVHIDNAHIARELDILEHLKNEQEVTAEEIASIEQVVMNVCGGHVNVIFPGFRVKITEKAEERFDVEALKREDLLTYLKYLRKDKKRKILVKRI